MYITSLFSIVAHFKMVEMMNYVMYIYHIKKKKSGARHRWLTPVILATQEAEIRRLGV
jgi:hypothetical protein